MRVTCSRGVEELPQLGGTNSVDTAKSVACGNTGNAALPGPGTESVATGNTLDPLRRSEVAIVADLCRDVRWIDETLQEARAVLREVRRTTPVTEENAALALVSGNLTACSRRLRGVVRDANIIRPAGHEIVARNPGWEEQAAANRARADAYLEAGRDMAWAACDPTCITRCPRCGQQITYDGMEVLTLRCACGQEWNPRWKDPDATPPA